MPNSGFHLWGFVSISIISAVDRYRGFIGCLNERITDKFKFLTKFPSFWYQIVHIFLCSTIFRHCVYCMLLKSPFIMHCCSEVNWRENDVAMTICLNLVLNSIAMTKEKRCHVEAIQTRSDYILYHVMDSRFRGIPEFFP